MVKLKNSKLIDCPKAFLDWDKKFKKGDFVTTDDACTIKVYIVKEIYDQNVCIYSLELTDAEDDLYIREYYAFIEDLLFVDDSFVNVNGILWGIRQKVLDGLEDTIKIN